MPTVERRALLFTISHHYYNYYLKWSNARLGDSDLPIFGPYQSADDPDLDDRIYLPTLMAAVEAEGVRASFLFVGLNRHHQDLWLGSTTTNRHDVAAFNFAKVPSGEQLVSSQPMHVVEHLTS